MHTAQHTLLAAVTAAAHNCTVYEDSAEGVGMYGTVEMINTVFNTVLAQLGATEVQGLDALAEADGSEDCCVKFMLGEHSMYLTTCYTS